MSGPCYKASRAGCARITQSVVSLGAPRGQLGTQPKTCVNKTCQSFCKVEGSTLGFGVIKNFTTSHSKGSIILSVRCGQSCSTLHGLCLRKDGPWDQGISPSVVFTEAIVFKVCDITDRSVILNWKTRGDTRCSCAIYFRVFRMMHPHEVLKLTPGQPDCFSGWWCHVQSLEPCSCSTRHWTSRVILNSKNSAHSMILVRQVHVKKTQYKYKHSTQNQLKMPRLTADILMNSDKSHKNDTRCCWTWPTFPAPLTQCFWISRQLIVLLQGAHRFAEGELSTWTCFLYLAWLIQMLWHDFFWCSRPMRFHEFVSWLIGFFGVGPYHILLLCNSRNGGSFYRLSPELIMTWFFPAHELKLVHNFLLEASLVSKLVFWTGPTAVELVPLHHSVIKKSNFPSFEGFRETFNMRESIKQKSTKKRCCKAKGRNTYAIAETKRVVKVSFAGFIFITDSRTHLKMMLATVVLDP